MSSENRPEAKGTPEVVGPESVETSSLERRSGPAPTTAAVELADNDDDIGPAQGIGAICENCGTPLQGRYCHACGQEARSLDVSFRSFAGEWLAAVLGFDGRIWRTLGRLLLSPGGLSVDYLEGRRARYVSPLRLYFFVSVAVFLAIAFSDSSVINFSERDGSSGSNLNYSWQTGDRSGHGSLLPDAPSSEEASSEPTLSEKPNRPAAPAEPLLAQDPSIADETTPGPLNEADSGEEPEEGADDGSESEVDEQIGQWVSGAAQSFESDPEAVNKAFLDRMPHAFFLLVPLYALFLKMLFRKRYKSYIQHLVVSLHLHTLGFVLLTIGTVTDYLLGYRGDEDGPVSAFAVIVLLVHSFMGFRDIYGDRRRTLLWKYALLSFAHLTSLILLLGIALIVTFALL